MVTVQRVRQHFTEMSRLESMKKRRGELRQKLRTPGFVSACVSVCVGVSLMLRLLFGNKTVLEVLAEKLKMYVRLGGRC